MLKYEFAFNRLSHRLQQRNLLALSVYGYKNDRIQYLDIHNSILKIIGYEIHKFQD